MIMFPKKLAHIVETVCVRVQRGMDTGVHHDRWRGDTRFRDVLANFFETSHNDVADHAYELRKTHGRWEEGHPAPQSAFLKETLQRPAQRPTVSPSTKSQRYQILTVPPTTLIALSSLAGLVGASSCTTLSNTPLQAVINMLAPVYIPTTLNSPQPPSTYNLSVHTKKKDHDAHKQSGGACIALCTSSAHPVAVPVRYTSVQRSKCEPICSSGFTY